MQAHSNYRIFPEHIQQGSASQQNVPPGTVVDMDIVHPTQTEFIIVAHKSIMVCNILICITNASSNFVLHMEIFCFIHI